MADTSQNRTLLRPLAKLVGAALAAGMTLAEVDEIIGRPLRPVAPPVANTETPNGASGPTVADYFRDWIVEQLPVIRKAQARDYKRHLGRYVLPALGPIPLAELKAADVRGCKPSCSPRGCPPSMSRAS